MDRRKEVAIQIALGSGRRRILRRMLTESLLRALLAGALGFVLALWGMKLIVGLIPPVYIPAEAEIDLGAWALAFAFAASLLAAGLFTLLPALYAMRDAQGELVKTGGLRNAAGSKPARLRSGLVVAEVALATVVLVAAGLMIRTYVGLAHVDPGFNPEKVLTFRVSPPEDRYGEPHRVEGFFRRLSDRVECLPGVRSVGAASSLPLAHAVPTVPVTLEGRSAGEAGTLPSAGGRIVRPGFFETLQIPVLQGRDFQRGDSLGSQPVVIVNQALARRFWGDRPPMGRRFKLGDADSDSPYLSVVGLVGDVREVSVESAPRPLFYLPHGQRTDRVRSLTLVLRTEGPPEALAAPVRALVADLDPLQPVHEVSTLGRIRVESLGAKPLAAALLLGLGASRAVGSFVYGVTPLDPATFVTTAVLFCLLGALGAYLPARAAARVDPAVTLRRG